MGLPLGLTVAGIDVSHYQHPVDWQAAAAGGIHFAFIKATDGGGVDPTFMANWAGAKAAGVIRGAYHFFRPADDPIAQKDVFAQTVVLEDGDLPPVLDVEGTPGLSLNRGHVPRIQQWLAGVLEATGCQPIIYTNQDSWVNQLQNPRLLSGYPLWFARYAMTVGPLPGGWSAWAFWQYSQAGQVPGIAGPVDRSVFNGTIDELRALTTGSGPLRLGRRGSLVVTLQQRLQDLGFNPGGLDGFFGPGTKAAVISFQTANRLPPDGVAGPETLKALGLG